MKTLGYINFAGNLHHYSFCTVYVRTSCKDYPIAKPRVFDRLLLCTKLAQSCMPTMSQSTVMGQLCSISIEGLKHVAPKWNNDSSKVHLLVLSLGQWCGIVAYQIPSLYCYSKNLLQPWPYCFNRP